MELLPARVLRVIGPLGADRQTAGVILRTSDKTFMIYVGLPEAQAILRELEGQPTSRPMTHDLMMDALAGFGVTLKRVTISSLVENTYFATISLQREPTGDGEGLREEVMLDARASDSIVLALKGGVELTVSRQVVEHTADLSEHFASASLSAAFEEFKEAAQDEEEDDEDEGWLPFPELGSDED